MIPVDQTDTSSTTGDCLRASVASLFELPIEDVPNFSLLSDTEWFKALLDFGNRHAPDSHNFTLRPRKFPVDDTDYGHVIGCGPSPRGDWWHAVILDSETGELVHDPHPTDKRGIEDGGIGKGYVLAIVTDEESA